MNKKQEKKKEDKVIQIHEDTNKLKQLRKEVINKYNKLNNEDKIKSSKDIGVTSTMTKTKRVLNARTTIEKDLIEVNDLLDDLVKKVDAEKKKDEIKRTEIEKELDNLSNNELIPINEKNDIDDQLEEVKKKQAKEKAWQKKLVRSKDSGNIKTEVKKNVKLILDNDPNLKGLFKYNRFSHDIDITEDKTIDLRKQGGGFVEFCTGLLQDSDYTSFAIYCESYPDYHVSFKDNTIVKGMEASAKQNSYNPLKDYMDNAFKDWDGKPHIMELFNTYLGVDDSEANKTMLKIWFIGAVAEVYRAGTKNDYSLDLVGGQGVGKTTLLRKISINSNEYYTDSFKKDFESPDSLVNITSSFIVNDDEMKISRSISFEELKKFTTMQIFKFRKPYARLPVRRKRSFAFARTTNHIDYIYDTSGDRRFFPIMVHKEKQKKTISHLTNAEIKQVWGDAVHLYKERLKEKGLNHLLELAPIEEALIMDNREQFIHHTDLEEELVNLIENDYKYSRFIPNKEIAQHLIHEDNFSTQTKLAAKVKQIMEEKLGYKQKTKNKQRGYQKI